MSIQISDKILEKGEYVEEKTTKILFTCTPPLVHTGPIGQLMAGIKTEHQLMLDLG